jgi:pimeloyl-ACP methyl ester carboxylesterase
MSATHLPQLPVALFLHGLDSSSRGTKGQWLRQYFPQVQMHDYQGELEERMAQLEREVVDQDNLILVGSSFGGLMAACFAINHPRQCRRLILLAPALNFGGYSPPAAPLAVPTLLVIGAHDTVCPPDLVLPMARATFANLTIRVEDDDHMLHRTFPTLDWPHLLI